MNRTKSITDGALLTTVYIVLLLLVLFVPFVFMLGIFILPIPFIIFTAKYGIRNGCLMLLAALGLTFIFATIVTLPLTLFAGIGGVAVGQAIYKQYPAYETWAQGTVGFIIGTLAIIAIMHFVLSVNIYTEVQAMIDETIEMARSMLTQFGAGADMMQQVELFEAQMRMFPDLIPASITIMSIFFAFIGQWLSYKILNRMENKQLYFPPFKQFNLPIFIIWIYFIALLLTFFVTESSGMLYIAVINVMALMVTLIMLQGYSFIFFYADYKKMHISVPIIVTIVTLVFSFLFMFIVRIIGIIDLGFQLKARLAHAEKK